MGYGEQVQSASAEHQTRVETCGSEATTQPEGRRAYSWPTPARLGNVDVAVRIVVKNAMVSESVLGAQELGPTIGRPQPGSEKWTS